MNEKVNNTKNWHPQHLRKNDVPPFGIGWDSTSNGGKPIGINSSFFQIHEFGQTVFQVEMDILVSIWKYFIESQKMKSKPMPGCLPTVP